ncbi:folate-sensitive fragile site protein Fra10Ac1-domain-containing protein [Melampsora americana]|nr:folate-sensitive fragile site protein Fra10Ac1-domain-containing protein [Melampsora americana]
MGWGWRGLWQIAMRWRTSGEVLDGKGDSTCSNLRCKHHTPKSSVTSTELGQQHAFISLDDNPPASKPSVALQVMQTQFGYVEDGTRKMAEVKLNLCRKCAKKMKACAKPSDSVVPRPSSSSLLTSHSTDNVRQDPDSSVGDHPEKTNFSRPRRKRSRSVSPRRHKSRSRSPRREISSTWRTHSRSPTSAQTKTLNSHGSEESSQPSSRIQLDSLKQSKFEPYRSTIAQWRQRSPT